MKSKFPSRTCTIYPSILQLQILPPTLFPPNYPIYLHTYTIHCTILSEEGIGTSNASSIGKEERGRQEAS